MKYLVFPSIAEATARNVKAFADGSQAGLFTEGTTEYCSLRRNPFTGAYALIIADGFTTLFTAEELAQAVELPSDWFAVGAIPGNFIIQQPISAAPTDATVSRVAFCNFPDFPNDKPNTLILTVVVRHYRNGEHIWAEIPDKSVQLLADDQDGEYSQFKAAFDQGADVGALTRQSILLRDSPEGGARFN